MFLEIFVVALIVINLSLRNLYLSLIIQREGTPDPTLLRDVPIKVKTHSITKVVLVGVGFYHVVFLVCFLLTTLMCI